MLLPDIRRTLSSRSRQSPRTLPTQRPTCAFALGACTGVRTTLIPSVAAAREHTLGISGVAIAAEASDGTPVAISIVVPTQRFDDNEAALVKRVAVDALRSRAPEEVVYLTGPRCSTE